MDEPERDRAVGGVVDGALALDEDPVAHRLGLLDEPLARAIEEVADDPVDGHAPAVDHHARLAGGHEDAPTARAATAALRSSSATLILPERAVRGHGQDHLLAGQVTSARADRPRPARAAGGSRRSRTPAAAAAAANSGSSPSIVWSPERMSRPAPIARRITSRQSCGSLPPVGAMPRSKAVGSTRQGASPGGPRWGCRSPRPSRRGRCPGARSNRGPPRCCRDRSG